MRFPIWSIVLVATLVAWLALPSGVRAQLSDRLPHPPPQFSIFTPANEGGTYVDPVFGSTVRRITNALSHPGDTAVQNEYSSINAVNADNTVIWTAQSPGGNGTFFSVLGGFAGPPVLFPQIYQYPSIMATNEPPPIQARWSHSNPAILYFTRPTDGNYYTGPDVPGNASISQLNVQTGNRSVVHAFPKYTNLTFQSSDLSWDGDFIAFTGNGRYFSWYQFSTDTSGPILDTMNVAWLQNVTLGAKGGHAPIPGPHGVSDGVHYKFDYESQPGVVLLHILDMATMTLQYTISDPYLLNHPAVGVDVDGTPIIVGQSYLCALRQ